MEEIRREPDKVHGQCRVGIFFIETAEHTQSLCNALLTIPIQAWPRVGLFFLFLRKLISTTSVWFER